MISEENVETECSMTLFFLDCFHLESGLTYLCGIWRVNAWTFKVLFHKNRRDETRGVRSWFFQNLSMLVLVLMMSTIF